MRPDSELLSELDCLVCGDMQVHLFEEDGGLILKLSQPGGEGMTLVGATLREVLNELCELSDV
jgi:hypothetical protein